MRTLLLLILGLGMLAAGCAGVADFRLPQEFREKKLVEDPPGAALPVLRSQAPC